MKDFSFPMIAMSYCKNTTANNNWCKSKDDIDDFLRVYPQFFLTMNTHVHEDIYKDHPLVEQFPYNGEEKTYFPTVYELNSIKFGTLDPDPTHRNISFMVEDL